METKRVAAQKSGFFVLVLGVLIGAAPISARAQADHESAPRRLAGSDEEGQMEKQEERGDLKLDLLEEHLLGSFADDTTGNRDWPALIAINSHINHVAGSLVLRYVPQGGTGSLLQHELWDWMDDAASALEWDVKRTEDAHGSESLVLQARR